jgi:hypothetical protein
MLGTILTEGSKKSLSSDTIFKPSQISGFPVLSIDNIYTNDGSNPINSSTEAEQTGAEDSAAIYDPSADVKNGAGDASAAIFYNDAATESVNLVAHFSNPDDSAYYDFVNVTINGKECKVEKKDSVTVGDVYYLINVPKSVVKSAFDSNPNLTELNMNLDIRKEAADITIGNVANRATDLDVSDGETPTPGTNIETKIVVDKTTVWSGTNPGIAKYGDSGKLYVDPKDGYEVVSANVVTHLYENGKLEEKPEDFTDAVALSNGVSITLGSDTTVKVYVRKKYEFKLHYDDVTDPDEFIKGEGGVFNVHYNRPFKVIMYQHC